MAEMMATDEFIIDNESVVLLPDIGCIQEVITSDQLLSMSSADDNLTFPEGLLPSRSPTPPPCDDDDPQSSSPLDSSPQYLDCKDMATITNILPSLSCPLPDTDLTNEGTYFRELVLGANHPNLQALEAAVGPLSSNGHQLYEALLNSTIQLIDSVLMEALRILSSDPSLRKLQAGLDVESELMDAESINYRPIMTRARYYQRLSHHSSSATKRKRGRKNVLKKRSRKREKTSPASQKLLKEWLFAHSSCPYPTEEDKCHLCHLTGLTLQQLNNWFINARRRILPYKKDK